MAVKSRMLVLAVVVLLIGPRGAVGESKREALRNKYKQNVLFNAPSSSTNTGAFGYGGDDLLEQGKPALSGREDVVEVSRHQVEHSANQKVMMDAPLSGAFRPAPVTLEYAIYQAESRAEIEEDIAFVKQHVELEAFSKGITRIPLTSANVGLKEVSVNGKPSVVNRSGSTYDLLLTKPGRYKLYVEFFVRVARDREHGPGSFTFHVMPSPISIFDVEIAEPSMDIYVEPSLKLEREVVGGKTLATVVLPYTEQVTVRWDKAVDRVVIPDVKQEPKVYVEVSTLMTIGEGVAQGISTLEYAILQSELSNLKILVPKDLTILDVHGNELRDWKVVPEGERRVLEVYLNRSMRGAYQLQVTYEKTIGEGSVTTELPELTVLGADRQRGMAGIQAKTNVEVAFGRLTNAAAIDVKELPEPVWRQASNPILLAYKYSSQPVTAEISVTKHAELSVLVAAIDSGDYATLLTDEGKVLTRATLQVRNNVKQFMRFQLPSGATLLSAFVSGKPVKPAQDKEGHVLVPLEKSESLGETVTQFPVEVMYLSEQNRLGMFGSVLLALPKLDIPTSQVVLTLYAPTTFNYGLFRGDLTREQQVMPMGLIGGRVGNRRLPQGAEEQMAQQQFEPSYSKYARSGKLGLSNSEVLSKGTLPIRMALPTQGRALRFSKLLVMNEAPQLSFVYLKNVREGRGLITGFIFLGCFGLVAIVLHRSTNGSELSPGLKLFLGLLVLSILAGIWLGQVSLMVPIAGLIGGLLERLFVKRKSS